MKDVVFKPWIGKDYETGGIFGKKILVLGESHYGFTDEEDATNQRMKFLLSGGTSEWTGTFRKFERSLVGHYTDTEESNKIWNSVAFYNFIQKSMDLPRQAPDQSDFKDSSEAFYQVLNELQPYLIIAWGTTRMYWYTPGNGWTEGEKMIVDGHNIPNGYYELENHKKIRAVWVRHPSAAYSWKWWYKVLHEEISQ